MKKARFRCCGLLSRWFAPRFCGQLWAILGSFAWAFLPADAARAQYSSGLIATPSADVLPPGQLSISHSRLIPEWGRAGDSDPSGRSLSVGLGLFPGLEVHGRLVQAQRLPGQLGASDQMVGLKYQFPIQPLPLQGRLAVGINDLSNSRSAFRQEYLVGTFEWGPIEGHIGYGQAQASEALAGVFGGVALRITERLHLLADNDNRKTRTAVRYAVPQWAALPDWQPSITLGSGNAMLSLSIDLDGRSMRKAMRPESSGSQSHNWELGALIQETRYQPRTLTVRDTRAITESFRDHGFGEIWLDLQLQPASPSAGVAVTNTQSGPHAALWQIWVEPVSYRKNRMDGLGAALAAWLKIAGTSEQRVLITLTQLGQPVLSVETSGLCIAIFQAGRNQCDLQDALIFRSPNAVGTDHGQGATVYQPIWLRPQFSVGPALDLATGRESHLADTSTGMAFGIELPLRPGLLLQSRWLANLSDSPGFKGPESPFRQAGSGIEPGLDRLLLSIQRPWLQNTLWTELAIGRHGHDLHGLLATASWSPDQGRFRITTQAGELGAAQRTVLATARLALVPGRWAIGLTGGQFLNEDVGYRLESRHQFGDNTLSLYFQDTRDGNSRAAGAAQVVGVHLSLALGPKTAWRIGNAGATLRTTDQIDLRLAKDRDGQLPLGAGSGYGRLPPLAHGLLIDTLDRDRADSAAIRTNLYRARAMLREQHQSRMTTKP
jgi:hypothetical protein